MVILDHNCYFLRYKTAAEFHNTIQSFTCTSEPNEAKITMK